MESFQPLTASEVRDNVGDGRDDTVDSSNVDFKTAIMLPVPFSRLDLFENGTGRHGRFKSKVRLPRI